MILILELCFGFSMQIIMSYANKNQMLSSHMWLVATLLEYITVLSSFMGVD